MSELKTLKDLKNQDFSECNQEFVMGYLSALKDSGEEAIKWVKNRGIKIDSDFCEFHNITEENLK